MTTFKLSFFVFLFIFLTIHHAPFSFATNFTRDLYIGTEGADVTELQVYLNTHGFIIATDGVGSPGNETTFFGNRLEAALKRFQEAHAAEILTPNGLTEGTGIFGATTRGFINGAEQPIIVDNERDIEIARLLFIVESLKMQLAILLSNNSSEASLISMFTRNLNPGDTGEDVKFLQQFLNEQGFVIAISGAGSLGNETTYYGLGTQNAITAFQEAHAAEILTPNGLTEGTGIFGATTRAFVNNVVAHTEDSSILIPVSTVTATTTKKSGGGSSSSGGGGGSTIDTQAPSVPTSLVFSAVASSSLTLTWASSTDAVAVSGYRVYRGTTQVATTTVASYTDTGLSASTSYTYNVSAFDAATNVSATSTSVSTTTLIAMEWIHFSFSETSGAIISSTGYQSPFPDITLNGTTTNLHSVPSKLTIHSAGNHSTRIFGNSVIDNMMRLDDLTGGYKAKFFATKIKRYVGTTSVSAAERIFQYGDQGSSSANPNGGWVARINFGASPFPTKSLGFAIHTTDRTPTSKPGGQTDPDFPDPIATTAVISDGQWEAGFTLMLAVDNSVSPYCARIYIDGILNTSDCQSDLAWSLPGISTNGPGNDATSNGLTFFAQSTNQGIAPLKDAEVDDIWIGQAADTADLAAIATQLHADITESPY